MGRQQAWTRFAGHDETGFWMKILYGAGACPLLLDDPLIAVLLRTRDLLHRDLGVSTECGLGGYGRSSRVSTAKIE
jgi:hypothetical protein